MVSKPVTGRCASLLVVSQRGVHMRWCASKDVGSQRGVDLVVVPHRLEKGMSVSKDPRSRRGDGL